MEKQMIEEIAVDLSKVQMPTTLDKKTWNLANELIRELLMAEYEFKRQEVKDISFLPFFVVRLAEKDYRKQEWISVEERLPNKDELVLCIGAKGGMFLGDRLSLYCDEKSAYAHVPNSNIGRHAVYWMPLPQPPKMRGE